MSARRLSRAVLVTVLAALAPSVPAQAQQVRGLLLDEMDARPLAGAYVVLLRDGREVVGTVTRVDGGFRLTAPEPGPYLLRADHLGYATVEREVVLPPPGTPLELELLTSQEAIAIEGLVTEADDRCRLPRPVAVQVVSLWNEVGEAFQVATLLDEQRLYDMRVERWRRDLEPTTLRVVAEERQEDRGIQRTSPFRSLPPDDLARDGYVQELPDGTIDYHAPDARVLLSRSFQDTHCFGITIDPPEDGEADWVGIRFDPRERGRPEIRGVLWVDRALQPQRLDYVYTELPGRVGSDDLGGRVSFRRLPDGPWIVSSWRIRMPRVQGERFHAFDSAEPRYRYEMVGIEEVGGQVVQAGPRGGELLDLARPGVVQGVVRDDAGRPAAGATVALGGTFYRAVADGEGRFRLSGVPGGRYRLLYSSPALDSLGLEPEEASVEVRADEPAEVELALPSTATLLARACSDPVVPGGVGLLRGVVRAPDGRPVPFARVELSWTERLEVGGSGAGRVSVRQGRATAVLEADEDGRWSACGLPDVGRLVAKASWTGARRGEGAEQEVRVARADDRGSLPRVELDLPEPEEVEAAAELPAAELGIDGSTSAEEARLLRELAVLGIRRETLGRRFVGPEEVEEQRAGSMDALDMIGVVGIPGVRVRILASTDEPCIYSRRNVKSSFSGGVPEPICAAVILDGVPANVRRLESVPGSSVAAFAYLRPSEAGARLGSGTDGGALLVWTRLR